jgi:hypothetical protein
MSIPNKGFFDPEPDQTTEKPPEPPTDSVVSAINRHQQMEAEAAEKLKAGQEAEARRLQREEQATKEARKEEDAFIDKIASLSDITSRDALLERIREMRAEKPPAMPPPSPPHPAIAEQTRLEMEVGARNVAQAEAQRQANMPERLKALKEDAERQGGNVPVYHPNPTMNEKFPVNKATIK